VADYLGHCIARVPGTERVAIKPKHSTRVHSLRSLRAADMITVDLDGNQLSDGEHRCLTVCHMDYMLIHHTNSSFFGWRCDAHPGTSSKRIENYIELSRRTEISVMARSGDDSDAPRACGRRFLTLGAIILGGGLLAACSSGGASGTSASGGGGTNTGSTTINFGFSDLSVDQTPMLVANDEGFFKQNHLVVNYKEFNGGGSTVAAALASNSLDGAHGSLEFLESNAKKITNVVAVQQISQSAYQIYTNSDITSPSQLAGKKIGVSSLSGAEYIWWNSALPALGIPVKSVHFVVISGGSAKFAALKSGAIDAIVDTAGHEPTGAPKPLVTFQNLPQQPHVITFTKSWLDAHKTAVQEFITSINEATVWTKSHKAAATEVCEKDENATAAECNLTDDIKPPTAWTWSATGALNVQSIEDTAPDLEKLYPGVTDAGIKAFLDTSFAGTNP
jgi:NitT/TauT family transport system substrate-binding protein